MTHLTLEFIKHVTGEFDEASVFQAILSHRQIARIDAVGRCSNLRWLDLSNNHIIRMENLAGLAKLASLDLSFNKIQKVQSLEGMQSLERLMLKANPISRLQDLEGLRPAVKLRHLQFRNVDNTDFCPVCLQEDYLRTVKDLCPDLAALDSRRRHLPDLDKEVQRLDELRSVELPEPEPWFSTGDLLLGDIQDPDAIAAAMQPHMDGFEAALGDCRAAMKEAEELLRLQSSGDDLE
uniref:U2A'/phosphoprotein 32 family A C-terminal domain-containing protein n=1 Tax=Alexandrium monilatum TaxID=311494 RepID=A0A6T1M0B3_9DINO|mmetsp:Transcript_26819/g.79956  ORF Transcript_26819/g.79956 Transcript_26819/m.79956 type:complete len:236 (-) Transcript_26819:69-776(-)